ncbi:polar amino acid transport system permease protein [Constrictibacter sp. MBR-5]|jgi:polar amino acid transport system permease protein|uniref:amino acid ABC transporter permease n=1 Tax=Constrictibacter sp. MBR-5 TaxID=3156467 RepID=UPI0033944BDE
MEQFAHNFFNVPIMLQYLPEMLKGLVVTLELAALVVLTGLSTGLLLALGRSFQFKPANFLIVVLVDICRALPPLVLIILVYFALPFVGVQMSGFAAAWLVLSLVLASFSEEIFWAGITSVQRGQWEASRSTGLSFVQTLGYVVLPQAFKLTIPPLTNRTIAVTKNTALASVVAVDELLTQAGTAQAYSANTSPLTVAAIGYLLIFFPLVVLSRWVESRYGWKR